MAPPLGATVDHADDAYGHPIRDYHEHNRERGRLPGATRMRARYRGYATDWFDYLMVSPAELRKFLAETPWTVAGRIHADDGSGQYVAVLEKPGR